MSTSDAWMMSYLFRYQSLCNRLSTGLCRSLDGHRYLDLSASLTSNPNFTRANKEMQVLCYERSTVSFSMSGLCHSLTLSFLSLFPHPSLSVKIHRLKLLILFPAIDLFSLTLLLNYMCHQSYFGGMFF